MMEMRAKLEVSLAIVRAAFARVGNDARRVAVAFNGGKDSVAMMHVIALAMDDADAFRGLTFVYFHCADVFPDQLVFLHDECNRRGITLLTVPLQAPEPGGAHWQRALRQFAAACPDVSIVFMGTRCADPHASAFDAAAVAPPSANWPPLTRVAPLLAWAYQDVWVLIDRDALSYCDLYARGYTSLGGRATTRPHPALAYTSLDTGDVHYRHARCLVDGHERDGRDVL